MEGVGRRGRRKLNGGIRVPKKIVGNDGGRNMDEQVKNVVVFFCDREMIFTPITSAQTRTLLHLDSRWVPHRSHP